MQETTPFYISTFTDYDLTDITSTLDVFFTNYDTSIFSTDVDQTSADTKQLKFDLTTYTADGNVKQTIATDIRRKIYLDFPGGSDPIDSDTGFLEEYTLTFGVEIYDCSLSVTTPTNHLEIIG